MHTKSNPPSQGKPAILFIHGAGVDHHWWSPQINALGDSFIILNPDLPGHGERAKEPFQTKTAIRDLEALLHKPGIAPALIVGISLGGYLAIRLAAQQPEKISGLLLSGCSMNLSGATGIQFKLVGLFLRLRGANWIAEKTSESYRKRFDNETSSLAIPNGIFGKAAIQSFGQIAGYDYHTALEHTPSPVLLLNGELDEANVAQQDALAARIPNGTARTLTGAGHLANLEKPEEFTAEIRRFAESAFHTQKHPAAG